MQPHRSRAVALVVRRNDLPKLSLERAKIEMIRPSPNQKAQAPGNCHSNELHSGFMKGSTMASNALVQTRIDADVKEKATAVLETMGLTVSDAVRILLTRTANEGALPLELVSNSKAYDGWFREKVHQALADRGDYLE